MFDKLIESNSAEAEFKPRQKFFMVSSVIVGILFISAVVASLYAQDIELGTDNFELAELLAPIAPDQPEPEPPHQQPRQTDPQQTESTLPTRQQAIARLDQVQDIPTAISTTPNKGREIPWGNFKLSSGPETDGIGSRAEGTGNNSSSSASAGTEDVADAVKPVEPPPVAPKPAAPKPPMTLGVITGRATFLPNPPYPRVAQAVGAEGVVNVQVTIDEAGKVISSKAVSGHPLLRQTAETAAWKARFSPTLLSKVPVKVTGIIAFNFKRS